MQITRRTRTRWSRWLVASLLFMQMATAAYACSMGSIGAGMSSMKGMPCAEAMAAGDMATMDPDQPGLCHEHCKGGSETIEPGAAAAVALPARVVMFVLTASTEASGDASGWQAQQRSRESVRPPPHAILHCCFRI